MGRVKFAGTKTASGQGVTTVLQMPITYKRD